MSLFVLNFLGLILVYNCYQPLEEVVACPECTCAFPQRLFGQVHADPSDVELEEVGTGT